MFFERIGEVVVFKAAVRFVSSDFILALFFDFSFICLHNTSAKVFNEPLSERSCHVVLMTRSSSSFLHAGFNPQGFLSLERVKQV